MNPVISEVFHQVKALFHYAPDDVTFPRTPDHWDTYADEVEHNEAFNGDCDDFSMTCADLLIRAGISKDEIRLATCVTVDKEGHMVCIADGYVLDCVVLELCPWNWLNYTWIESMKMSEPGTWRRME